MFLLGLTVISEKNNYRNKKIVTNKNRLIIDIYNR